jgi:molybdate transport system ATP-binding protein
VLLFDESFSALDRAIRERLHDDIRVLQAEEQLIVLYVTHNLDDAFAIGQRLAVVRDGRIEQIGQLDDVFTRPANRRVLDILGIPNVMSARVVESSPAQLLLDWDGLLLAAPPVDLAPGAEVTAYIRPEDIRLIYPERPLSREVAQNHLRGTVVERRPGRHVHQLQVALPDGQRLEVVYLASAYTTLTLTPGAPVQLALRKESIVIIAPRHDEHPVAPNRSPATESLMRSMKYG